MSAEEMHGAIIKTSEKVLSAWFYDQKFKAAWKPEPALFLLPAHRAMAEVMAARGVSLDDGSLTLELRRLDKLVLFEGLGGGTDIQGAHAIASIVHGTMGVLDPWEALRELRELVALRALRMGLLEALRGIDSGDDLAKAKTAVAGALVATEAANPVVVANLRQTLGNEVRRMLGGTRAPGSSTGSVALDKVTGGLRSGDVWVIGAPTNWGKSSYLCSLFRQVLRQEMRMLIISGEDPQGLYAQRILTGLTGVNAWRAREGALLQQERSEISQALTGIPDFPFFLDAVGRTAEAVAADVRSTLACSDVPGTRWIVAIDYVQAFRSALKHQDKRNEIIHCSRLFTDAIKRAGAAGVMFSQVTRDQNGKVKMREAEDLINAAEVGLYGEIEEVASLDCDGRKKGMRKERSFFVAKIKNGASGFSVPLSWDSNSASFYDNTQEIEQEQ
jgi:replicative DNA helicase